MNESIVFVEYRFGIEYFHSNELSFSFPLSTPFENESRAKTQIKSNNSNKFDQYCVLFVQMLSGTDTQNRNSKHKYSFSVFGSDTWSKFPMKIIH